MRLLATFIAIALSGVFISHVQAKSEFFDVFQNKYKAFPSVGDRACGNCHTTVSADTSDLNPYGLQVRAEMKAERKDAVDDQVLSKVENLRAGKSPISNIEAIRSGQAPGNAANKPVASTAPPAASHPPTPAHTTSPAPKPSPNAGKTSTPTATITTPATTAPAGASTTTTTTGSTPPATTVLAETPAASEAPAAASGAAPKEPEPPTDSELWPKNRWHPAIVHFPIALFLAGLFLDFIGYWKKDKNLLYAGWYNLVLAALSAVAACATGLLVTIRMDKSLTMMSGDVMVPSPTGMHMAAALAFSFIAWGMVALRVYRHDDMPKYSRWAYYVLAVLGFITISAAGHLGGRIVYGG